MMIISIIYIYFFFPYFYFFITFCSCIVSVVLLKFHFRLPLLYRWAAISSSKSRTGSNGEARDEQSCYWRVWTSQREKEEENVNSSFKDWWENIEEKLAFGKLHVVSASCSFKRRMLLKVFGLFVFLARKPVFNLTELLWFWN